MRRKRSMLNAQRPTSNCRASLPGTPQLLAKAGSDAIATDFLLSLARERIEVRVKFL